MTWGSGRRSGDRASSWRSSRAGCRLPRPTCSHPGCLLQVCRDCGSQLGRLFLCGDRSSQFHKGACTFLAVLGDRMAGKAGLAARVKPPLSPAMWTVKTLPRSALCLQAVSMDSEMFQSEELRGWVESRGHWLHSTQQGLPAEQKQDQVGWLCTPMWRRGPPLPRASPRSLQNSLTGFEATKVLLCHLKLKSLHFAELSAAGGSNFIGLSFQDNISRWAR